MKISKIRKNIAIPPINRNGFIHSKYPFAKLKVKESFMITRNNEKLTTINHRVRVAAQRFQNILKRKFAVRTIDKNTVGVWRTV